jgi:hypothetical protein
LNFKSNKTLLWEISRLSLEKDWEKHDQYITVEIEYYEQLIKAILNMRHFNYLKQFMVKLFRNNLHFKNVTQKFSDSGTLCNSCKIEHEDRIHFFLCRVHQNLIETLFYGFTDLKILKRKPNIQPYFYNTTLPLNHATNIIYISMLKCIYNLRYFDIVPTKKIVKNHLSTFLKMAVLMYPDDLTWKRCSTLPMYFNEQQPQYTRTN